MCVSICKAVLFFLLVLRATTDGSSSRSKSQKRHGEHFTTKLKDANIFEPPSYPLASRHADSEDLSRSVGIGANILPSLAPTSQPNQAPTEWPLSAPSPIRISVPSPVIEVIQIVDVSVALSLAYTLPKEENLETTRKDETATDEELGAMLSDALTRIVSTDPNAHSISDDGLLTSVNHRSVQFIEKRSKFVSVQGATSFVTWTSFQMCFQASRRVQSPHDLNSSAFISSRTHFIGRHDGIAAFDGPPSVFSSDGIDDIIDNLIAQGTLLDRLIARDSRIIDLVRKGDEDFSLLGSKLPTESQNSEGQQDDNTQVVGLLLFSFTVISTVLLCVSSRRRKRLREIKLRQASSSIALSSEEKVNDFLAQSSLTFSDGLAGPSVYFEMPRHLLESHDLT